jgi:hypothetical protein
VGQQRAPNDPLRGLPPSVRTALAKAFIALSCGMLASCGGKAATSGSSAGLADGGMCPPLLSSTDTAPPSSADCTEFVNGMWRKAACDGELALRNPANSPVSVRLSLQFAPSDHVPSLTDSPDVELHIDDAEASWSGVWAKQPGNGTLFVVTNEGGMTTVRLGTGNLSLAAVPLAGCEARTTTGSVLAPYGDALYFDMKATLTTSAGNLISTISGEAYQLAAHPTVNTDGGGDSGDAGPPQ